MLGECVLRECLLVLEAGLMKSEWVEGRLNENVYVVRWRWGNRGNIRCSIGLGFGFLETRKEVNTCSCLFGFPG